MEKNLGKIESVELCLGGRNEDTLGVNIVFSGSWWGVAHFVNLNDPGALAALSDILKEAKVSKLSDLKGVPVECEFELGSTLSDWRILTEVL